MIVENKDVHPNLGPDYSGWRGFGLELIAFLFTAFMIFREGWSPTDLVWALWASSLLIGWAIILIWLAGSLQRGSIKGIGTALFFAFHFSFFHFGHAVFLTLFFPQNGAGFFMDGGPSDSFSQIPSVLLFAVQTSVFFIAATFIVRFNEIRAARKTEKLANALSYVSVVKMHIMIIFLGFAMVGLKASNIAGLPVLMLVVLMFHFFPVTSLLNQLKA